MRHETSTDTNVLMLEKQTTQKVEAGATWQSEYPEIMQPALNDNIMRLSKAILKKQIADDFPFSKFKNPTLPS